MRITQQTNFVRKLEENNGATMFFIVEKQQKTVLNFSLYSLIVTKEYNNGTSKNIKILNEANDSKFVTRKWNILNDNSKTNYNATNELGYFNFKSFWISKVTRKTKNKEAKELLK